MIHGNSTFIHVGQIHVDHSPGAISTVLGSCVAVCLYDHTLAIGAMNHYLLPFWNGNGLLSPKYGNVSIPNMVEQMTQKGSLLRNIEAKIFGGASININAAEGMMIGQKNILVAREILKEYNISLVAEDVGGENGRKIQFNLCTGKVLMKYTRNNCSVQKG